MTLTFESDLCVVRTNQRAKCLDQRHGSNVIVQTQYRLTRTGQIVLSGPLKSSVGRSNIQKRIRRRRSTGT